MGTHVLAGVGGHGRANALQRDRQELCRLAACSLCCHDVTAQTIDCTLQHNGTDGRDAALQTHGDAHAAQLDTVLSAQAAFFFVPAQLIIMLEDVPQAAQTGHCLAEHGGECRTEHAHLEDDDAEQVQPDVQKTCHQQEVQGPLAVAQSAHQGAGHVIQQGEWDADKDGADVDVRQINDVVRGIGPDQNGTGHGHRDHGKHCGKKDAQPDGIGGVAAHLHIVFCPERPRDGDGEAAGNAIDKAQHQIVQTTHTADCRQGFHAHKAAHDDGIRQIIELLEQAAQHQRHRKGKDQLEWAALRHIFRHTHIPPWESITDLITRIFSDKNAPPRNGQDVFVHVGIISGCDEFSRGFFKFFSASRPDASAAGTACSRTPFRHCPKAGSPHPECSAAYHPP